MVLIEGHRICGRLAPENSRAAVATAGRLGFVRSVEFDVRGTRDGEVVVLHGPEYEDCHECDYGELANLENGETVPLLSEIVTLCVDRKFLINAEIKEDDDRVIAAVVATVGASSAARVSSFNRTVLEKVRRRAPHIPLGLLVNDSRTAGDWDPVPADFLEFHTLPVPGDSVNFCAQLVTREMVELCHANGLDAMVWFPGDRTLSISDDYIHNLDKIVKMQPDVICTNRPDLLATLTLLN